MKEEILSRVYKPGRYLGNEWNAVRKDNEPVDLEVALCFPDLYEIGMSHLGFRIIYGLLNSLSGISCQRAFFPADDLERILRQENIPLGSLETDKPLSAFDIIGFSLSYELLYTGVLGILELSGIPLFALERDDTHPLIIAGGYSCVNPEPMADFIDCFIIGEAEEAIVELVDKVRAAKLSGKKKSDLLCELAQIEGIYVPRFYSVDYENNTSIKSFLPNDNSIPGKIKKRVISNLDNVYYPERWLLPFIQIIHDRVVLEVMRGCPHKCKFCQASVAYYPWRVRDKEKVFELARVLLKHSGYEEISFLGLSCGDYPWLEEVLTSLSPMCRENGVSLSLPSLRIKNYISGIPALLGTLKKTGLTFAPEAGSARLRRLIGKNMEAEELFKVTSNAYKAGYSRIKLYFMIGLPSETTDDLDAIAELAVHIVKLRKEVDNRLGSVTLSINAFVPKPHTEFERLAMCNIKELHYRQEYLLSKIKSCKDSGINRAIKVDFHNFEMGFWEAVLSRAGRGASGAIYKAFKAGARPLVNTKDFNSDIWRKAFSDEGIDPFFYVNRQIPNDEILPWGHINLASIV